MLLSAQSTRTSRMRPTWPRCPGARYGAGAKACCEGASAASPMLTDQSSGVLCRVDEPRSGSGSFFGVVGELLPAHAGLVHEPAFGHRKDRDARAIPGIRRCALSRGDGTDLSGHREMPAFERVERVLVLKEDDLGVLLTAELRAHGHLTQ